MITQGSIRQYGHMRPGIAWRRHLQEKMPSPLVRPSWTKAKFCKGVQSVSEGVMNTVEGIRRNHEGEVNPLAQKVHVVGPHLLDYSLPYDLWTDEAEFAAIVHVLVERPDLDASTALPLIIREYNASNCIAGVSPQKFHATLMEFNIRAVKHFIDTLLRKTCPSSIYMQLCATALILPDFVLNFYSARRLVSRRAYSQIVEPDLLPLTQDTFRARLWQHCA